MISIVMPVYNVSEYVKKSIDSVLNQTYTDIELIIVDDGSYDGTADICKRYACIDARVKYIRKQNEGQGIARTVGFSISRGDYVTFVDGDDWLELEAIEHMELAVKETAADIVVGDCWYVYNHGQQLEKRYSKVRYEDGQVINAGADFEKINLLRTFTWGKLYKRSFLAERAFSQPSYAYEDVATVPVMIALAKRIVYINKPVYNYLKNRTGSTIHDIQKVKDMRKALEQLYSEFRQLDSYEEYECELKRLIWGQIRFICKTHNISWESIQNGQEPEYKELLLFMKKAFDDFIFPDDCEMEIVNCKGLHRIVDNILISGSKNSYRIDLDDMSSRIYVKYNDCCDEYKLDHKFLADNNDETWIWDRVDEMFMMIWG